MTAGDVRAAAAAAGSSVPDRDGLTLDKLIAALAAARDVAEEHGLAQTGDVRFRFAIPYGELAGSTFGDVDPFGPIIAVTLTESGLTLVDIVPEEIEAKQGELL
jgi:hypothetical protein